MERWAFGGPLRFLEPSTNGSSFPLLGSCRKVTQAWPLPAGESEFGAAELLGDPGARVAHAARFEAERAHEVGELLVICFYVGLEFLKKST